jgi:hypothetical protein
VREQNVSYAQWRERPKPVNVFVPDETCGPYSDRICRAGRLDNRVCDGGQLLRQL